MIYLDYAASSEPFSQVIEEMAAVSRDHFGNPGALHGAGAAARQILQKSRFILAQLTDVRPEEIFFTSGGTEGHPLRLRPKPRQAHPLLRRGAQLRSGIRGPNGPDRL